MAITLGDINAVVRRIRASSRSVATAEAVRAFIAHLNNLGNPDLQLVEFAKMNSADKVIADAPCKLMAIYFKKPVGSTVDAWLKASNHGSAAAANGDFVAFLPGTGTAGKDFFMWFGDGLPMATGLTIQSHTTVNGNTKSANVDCASGFAIIAAP